MKLVLHEESKHYEGVIEDLAITTTPVVEVNFIFLPSTINSVVSEAALGAQVVFVDLGCNP
jgi:hypothetical protein